jgi:hypothetical protein
MPDAYEDTNALNKYVASDADSDSDEDGLSALQEFSLGTSPVSKDTDRDTLPDGWEFENERDPLVADYLISAGWSGDTCVIVDTGATCWGLRWDSASPINEWDWPELSNPAHISTGLSGHCALDEGEVVCRGYLFDEWDVPSLANPKQVSTGPHSTCAIDDTGVVCWGKNYYGQTDVPVLNEPKQVSVGGSYTCAIDATGVVCWGYSEDASTGAPVSVPILSNPKQISVGGTSNFGWVYNGPNRPQTPHHPYIHACALDDTGVVCWGSNFIQSTVPTLTNPTQVSVGAGHACALDDTGVVCWGSLYNGSASDLASVQTLINPKQVSAGGDHTCALDDTGVVCWTDRYPWGFTFPNLLIDPDGDGYSNQNGSDAFPLDAAEWLDTDNDGIGNNSDLDDDGDSVDDYLDLFPLDATESIDTDSDGIGNNADTDDDGDGLNDSEDDFPLDASEQLDTDTDGIGNNADDDDDNDGVIDNSDAYPLNNLYSADSDGDGMADAWELLYGLDPNDASDATSDQDNDGVAALDEFLAGTIPAGSLDIDGNGEYDALTDGLLLLRGMFLLSGDSLISDAVASDAVYKTSDEVASRIDMLGDLVDIDGNGSVDALTDGLVILRYLFNLRGDVLINDVIALDATVKTAEDVEAKIEQLIPSL